MAQQDLFNLNKPTSHDLARVTRLAQRAVDLEKAIEVAEQDLKAYKAEQLELRRELLPDAMAEHNLSEFKFADGSGVKVHQYASGTLPKTPFDRTFALRLLEEHGGEAIISNDLTVSFQKKDHNRAMALAEELRASGYDAQIESTVHPQTLLAWCREKVRAGERINFDQLGVFIGRDTKIILPGKE